MIQRYALIFIILLMNTSLFAQNEARLLRFPTVNGDQIVFSHAGDLYGVDRAGGIARKLTSHNGYEVFPKFSPDGSQIAFTGQYDGNTEVFTIPRNGGTPKRLTWTATLGRDDVADRMGPNNIVMAWDKKGENVVFRSRKKSFNSFKGHLYSVNTKGDLETQIPFAVGSWCSYSPDGKKIAFNKVFREFRTWKYYRGGMADDIWVFDFETKKLEQLFENPAQDIMPMWYENKIYFISDRDRTMNLFVFDFATGNTTKLTNFTDYDIKYPSLGDDAIVFEQAGYVHLYDLKKKQVRRVNIQILDDQSGSRKDLVDASKHIESRGISPDGKRMLFSARGDVFTVPVKEGITRNITQSPGVHDRLATWSPDGKQIAWVSDKSGEFEIYVQNQDGSGKAKQLTKNADTYTFTISWSPDSKKIMWADKKLRLSYVNVSSGKVTIVDKSTGWEMTDFDWSPDSKWIAYGFPEPGKFRKIRLYGLENKKSTEVTESWYESGSPRFSDDGKFLFFLSQREFNPIYSNTEWNHAYVDMQKIYFVTLAKETASPFEPVNDEVEIKSEEDDKKMDEKKEEKKDEKKEDIKVDVEGIASRIAEIPVKAARFWSLNSAENKLYYAKRPFRAEKTLIYSFDLKEKKETELGEANWFFLSSNRKKMVAYKSGKNYVLNMPVKKLDLKKPVSLSNMKMNTDKKAEWTQIYNECWRQMRDFFYAPNMHGVNWEAMRKKYAPLVEHVNHRNDLTYIIGELIGELNIGHAYVGGGDRPSPERIDMGLLGAELVKDASGYYQITKILNGENWEDATRSPFTEIGVNVNEGEFIIAVDGHSTKEYANIYEAFVNKANKQVELTINTTATTKGSRKEIIIPIKDEANLYYFNWVRGNIDKVNAATDGKVGYIHVPDMGRRGLNQFVKYFYPQLGKEALIIDVRGNGGGNVSPMLIERLTRELQMISIARNGSPYTNPFELVNGPKICLMDQYSASDGDLFPYRFRQQGIGKLIGQRSWGGVVGIRGSLPFIDGSYLRKPEFAPYDVEGKEWIIEGRGVTPDIVIYNDPYKEFMGEDQQLNLTIEEIKKSIKGQKSELPKPPPYPNKSR